MQARARQEREEEAKVRVMLGRAKNRHKWEMDEDGGLPKMSFCLESIYSAV